MKNPYEKFRFPQILDTLDCVHYSKFGNLEYFAKKKLYSKLHCLHHHLQTKTRTKQKVK